MRLGTVAATLAMATGLATAAVAADVAPGDVAFTDDGVAMSLTGVAGDPAEGANIFKNKKQGNCLACHANSAMSNQLFHGNVGPALDDVAGRYSTEQLRGIVTDSKKMFTAETVMPGFYSLEVGKNVRKDLVGKTILTAQQVEDVVAYLGTLKN